MYCIIVTVIFIVIFSEKCLAFVYTAANSINHIEYRNHTRPNPLEIDDNLWFCPLRTVKEKVRATFTFSCQGPRPHYTFPHFHIPISTPSTFFIYLLSSIISLSIDNSCFVVVPIATMFFIFRNTHLFTRVFPYLLNTA